MTEHAPRFSIATPVYNGAATLSATLDSVLVQRYQDWELIVVDDGSTDDTRGVAESYAGRDPRIHVISQPNAGCGAARATAIAHARGEFIVRLDADDELLEDYLESMSAFIDEYPGRDIYSCNGWTLFEDGHKALARRGERYEHVFSLKLEDMFERNHIFTIAVFRRDLYERVGGIRREVYCEDLDLWLRAFAHRATHIYLPKPLAVYRLSSTQMTADFGRICASRVAIYRDLIDSGLLTPEQVELAEGAILRTREDDVLFRQRMAFRARMASIFGKKLTDLTLAALHTVAWAIRPLFEARARTRLAEQDHSHAGSSDTRRVHRDHDHGAGDHPEDPTCG